MKLRLSIILLTLVASLLPFTPLLAMGAEHESPFSNWMKTHIPENYPGSTFDHHEDWYQVHIPTYDLTVSWGFMPQTQKALKDVEGLHENKSIFIAKANKEDWSDHSKINYAPNVGYHISEYSSAAMGHFNVGEVTVIQFDGKPNLFIDKMVQAYGNNPVKSQPEFVHWLKKYVNAAYPKLKVDYHGAWYQSVIPQLDLTISWGTMDKPKMAIKALHGVSENKSFFVEKDKSEGWERNPSVTYTKGIGYYISKYQAASMSNFEVGNRCVLQFNGNAKSFVETMTKAWAKRSELTAKDRVMKNTDFPPIGVVKSANVPGKAAMYKPRVINTTDLGADPDDKQSMVRQLVSANEFDIEGLIVATGCWRPTQSNTDMLDEIVNAYGKVYPNLIVHADGYPTPEYLKSISLMGQKGYGMSDVGSGKDSPGSELIIASADKDDPRPVWVMGWGGMNIAAQAIWKVRETRTPKELEKFLSKLRLFDILGQDDAGAWIAKNFPGVFYIRATGVYGWAPSDEYLANNIQNHGPLGAVYPNRKWATEGDSPAFMHVFPNGLNDPEQIDQGGWGGRFSFTKQEGIRSMSEVPKIKKDAESMYDPYFMYGNTSEKANAIKRWKNGYDNDFAARMDWSITGRYKDANHHPTAVLNGDRTRQVIKMTASAGSFLDLTAAGSSDPDGDSLSYSWSFYKEPSSYDGTVTINNRSTPTARLEIPNDAVNKTIHIILEVYDNGTPNLYAYRRVVVDVQPASLAISNEEPVAGSPYVPYPDKVVVTRVKHFDNMCWKIAAAGGTWYFENGETDGKSGFNSAFDQAGNDWIGNDADRGYNKSSSKGGRHEYRGWPNFGEGNFNHPQRKSNATSRWVDAAGNDMAFTGKIEGDHLIMRTSNPTYELEYHFFPTHAAIKIIKADNKYAFLFEGPVGGEQEASVDKDYYVLKDGIRRELKAGPLGYLEPAFGNKFPSPFFYLADSDPKDTQVFYAGVKNAGPQSAGDEGWRQGENMVIFSFGRDEDKRAYTGTEAVCVFGFYDKTAHKKISKFIETRLKDPFKPVKK